MTKRNIQKSVNNFRLTIPVDIGWMPSMEKLGIIEKSNFKLDRTDGFKLNDDVNIELRNFLRSVIQNSLQVGKSKTELSACLKLANAIIASGQVKVVLGSEDNLNLNSNDHPVEVQPQIQPEIVQAEPESNQKTGSTVHAEPPQVERPSRFNNEAFADNGFISLDDDESQHELLDDSAQFDGSDKDFIDPAMKLLPTLGG